MPDIAASRHEHLPDCLGGIFARVANDQLAALTEVGPQLAADAVAVELVELFADARPGLNALLGEALGEPLCLALDLLADCLV